MQRKGEAEGAYRPPEMVVDEGAGAGAGRSRGRRGSEIGRGIWWVPKP